MTLEAPCSGRTELQLFGNKAALGKTVFNVSTGTNKTEVEVPTRLWERAAESGKLNFSTLLIAAGGVLVCAEDPNETYPFADAFNAGMAVGE